MITERNLEEEVTEALQAVIDPEIGLNVVELGLMRNVDASDPEQLNITMILTTPFCPSGPPIIEQVRIVANSVTGGGTIVLMGTELWDQSMMEEGAGGDWGLF